LGFGVAREEKKGFAGEALMKRLLHQRLSHGGVASRAGVKAEPRIRAVAFREP
jgi:hypothetical protein